MSKKNKNPIIKFMPNKAEIEGIFDPPVPSKMLIPEWYKNQSNYTNNMKEYNDVGLPNHTIKACMPVFDLITSGYIITTPCDVIFNDMEDGAKTSLWSSNSIKFIETHSVAQYDKFNNPNENYPVAFKFMNPWIIQTEPGYSCLFMQPAFRDDLPFTVLPAIVDTDKHPVSINFPFFLRKDFTGKIEMGTPMVQIIPFKREVWDSEVAPYDKNLEKIWNHAEGKMGHRYKTFFRSIKEWR